MTHLLKRLLQDRRGNALVIAAATLPLVVGSAGLATDTIQWTGWKRQLQRAADSAAIAGVYGRVQNQDVNGTVTTDLSKNNHLWVPLLSGYPQVSTPTDTSNMTYTTRVELAVRQKLGFSSLFLSTPPTITVSATAAMVPDGTYCVVALQPNNAPGLLIGGSTNVSMGCGAISNSPAANSVQVSGNSHTFAADPVAAVGGVQPVNGAGELQPYQIPLADPYAGLSTAVPAGTNCTSFNSHVVGGGGGGQGGTYQLTPGCFSNFNAGNHTYELQPGTYYLNNTSMNLSGHTTLVGDGVTIILTGTNPGTVTVNGTSTIDLSAPTTGPYANMLLVQSANAAPGNNNTINGSNNSALDGAIYFPNGDLTFAGSAAGLTQCTMIVGLTVEFTGSAAIQNDTSSCTAATQVEGKKIRLIA